MFQFSLFLGLVLLAAMGRIANAENARHTTTTTKTKETIEPPRLSYQELENLLREETTQREQHVQRILQEYGFFSITDIPGMGWFKPQMLQSLQPCVEALQPHVAEVVLTDGTLRQTLATTPDQPTVLDSVSALPESCQTLEETSRPFRETVAEVSRTVAKVLQVLGSGQELWKDAQGRGYNWKSTIQEGQQLEHFHVYHAPNTPDSNNNETSNASTPPPTLDWHTDQGLLLLFSPAVSLSEQQQLTPTQHDFFVQLANGSKVAVEFSHADELVVLLGQQIPDGWRAVPHALRVTATPRLWYGRMVLPPAQALAGETTFGGLRQEQIRGLQQDADANCQPETQQYCWHRCMNYSAEASPEACAALDATLACSNPQRQLWTPDQHDPSYALNCWAEDDAEQHVDPTEHSPPPSGEPSHDNNHNNEPPEEKENGNATSGAVQRGWAALVYLLVAGSMPGGLGM